MSRVGSAALPGNKVLPSAQSLSVRELGRTRRPANSSRTDGRAPIRFIYLGEDGTSATVDRYHEHLVRAEVLLRRILTAQAHGLRPIHMGVGARHHRRVFTRPNRAVFRSPSPEYRRWFTEFGGERTRPLTVEELAIELTRLDGCPVERARAVASTQSWALTQSEQDWLVARAEIEAIDRPLHREEVDQLAMSLESIVTSNDLPAHTLRCVAANRDIAYHAAATLGAILDAFTPSPFADPMLTMAFSNAHASHLADTAFAAFPTAPTHAVNSWYLAKRQQLRSLFGQRVRAADRDHEPVALRQRPSP